MPTTELEDFDALLRSPGWRRFANHAEREWGELLQDKIKMAVSDKDDPSALAKLRQVMVAKESIERLMRWPNDRLAELQRAAENRDKELTVPLSRRGNL